MSQQGSTTIDFGAFPGVTDVTVTVTGITGTPAAGEAWIIPSATVDHSADEHWVDGPEVYAGIPSAGSMVIYGVGKTRSDAGPISDSMRIKNIDKPRIYGKWTVGWVVN